MIVLNVLAIALWTTGVFASLYAGYLNPALRVTSSTLSAVKSGPPPIMSSHAIGYSSSAGAAVPGIGPGGAGAVAGAASAAGVSFASEPLRM